jgi:AraC-like DNA-binding protein
VRLRRAVRLLETTDLPVGVVAERVGYASRSYFSRAFKELYGTYPAGFRAGGAG